MTPIDLHAFLRTRRSIRRFKATAIPASVLDEILRTATYAPSAHNRQPWRFAVVAELSAKRHFAEEMCAAFERELEEEDVPRETVARRVARSRERILSAPVIVVLSVDMSEMDAYPDRRRKKLEYVLATQSAANAGLQLLLAAHAEGLGGVWICSPLFAQATVRTALNLPQSWEPQAMFLLGYPNEIPRQRERKPLEQVLLKGAG